MRTRLPRYVTLTALLTLGFLYLPMLAVGVFSLNASRHGMVWRGFTLQWYVRLLHNDLILEAARNTLVLAVVSTAVATVLGTLLAVGMARFPWPRWARGAARLPGLPARGDAGHHLRGGRGGGVRAAENVLGRLRARGC